MDEKINSIKDRYTEQILSAQDLKELDRIYIELFGKSGQITLLPRDFPTLPKEQLKIIGPLFNQTKIALEQAIDLKRIEIREQSYQALTQEEFDIDQVTEIKKRQGQLHPITEFEKKIADLFEKIGFQQFDGPQIDTDINNFEKLNIPPEHPARDMWDTLYLDQSNMASDSKLLLRTHTSNTQIHVMRQFKPPFRMMTIGRCFRYENLDARHEHTFDQFEIIYVDKGLSMANLQYLSEYLLQQMFGTDITVRLSPGYYPFTEPSAHIFGLCVFCKGAGCKICGGTGELELAGAGMIHPKVLQGMGIDSEVYSGIAWGVGPGRMAMLKYDVNDVRLFNSGDLTFLKGIHES
jgi:phenylalanyl-tRNA synthetase alpha chain